MTRGLRPHGFERLLLLFIAAATVSAAEPRTSLISLPGGEELQALRTAFPERVGAVAIRHGEWALEIDGIWYYWAEGRILPEENRLQWEQFVPIRFYNYRLGRWEQPFIPPELEARLQERTATRNNDDRIRFNSFLDNLYGVSSRAEADRLMERVSFFGMSTHVHPLVVEPLQRVETRIRETMMVNEEVRRFIADLASVHGYNWRVIAGTRRRSYHAYGMAVDLVPRSYRNRWAYWRWAADSGVTTWWRLGGDERWGIPQTVIDAFEAEGFVWGGKWLFFDNVHFEYRPEVILIARSTS
ncbi:MAG: M15 family metallopeptidase, partial [Alkalispirochaeta sp.]